ncbi:chloride channel protein [Verrucomicrobia bacterium LW23]|nr:chloride channel protein [Verrucomicrobia bacterium LW23]
MTFPLELNQPYALLALAVLGLLYYWQLQTLAPLSPWRRNASFLLRCLGVVLLVLALTDPRWLSQTRQTAVAWVVDRSRSVGEEAEKRAVPFFEETQRAAAMPSWKWIPFAGRSELVPTVAEGARVNIRQLRDENTNIAGALQFAQASLPPGYAKTIVLFSDGRETEGDLAETTRALKAAGVRVMAVPVQAPPRPEVLVRSVSVPRQIREEQPFQVGVEIVSNVETDAEVDIFRNGARIATTSIKLKPGTNRLENTQAVKGDKVFEYSAAVRAKSDTIVDNNQAGAVVQAQGKSKVLLIADKPDQARYLAVALRQEGIILDVRPATGAPVDLADLQNYDLVLLDNVPATDLSPAQLELFATYVRDFGGGLLMLGGNNSFGLGGYYQTPVEDLLPVRCNFEKQKEDPSLALALVIDRSGSMGTDKMEMAKDASKAAVELLGPRDYVTVIAFDHEAYSITEMVSAADKAGVQQKISEIQSGGGTNIAPGLEMAYARLPGCPAKIKHVILLTDGVSSPGPFREMVSRMVQERITVSAVALGSDSDQALLQDIANWGAGRYYFTDNPTSVPQIFARETMTASKSSVQELPFIPKSALPAPFLTGIDMTTAPFLLGFVMTRLKPTAEVWLTTETGEPLLTTWRYGLGQSGAFTSDARNRWAVEWLKWDGYGKFWAQTIRKLMRSASISRAQSTFKQERGGMRLTMDVLDDQGRYLPEATGELLLLDPQGKPTKPVLTATAPGRLEAWFPTRDKGAYHLQATLRNGTDVLETQYLSASTSYSEEFLLQPPDEAGLNTLCRETGGIYNPTPAQILADDTRTASSEMELWIPLVIAALAVFTLDVAVRRWPA